ncbi:MAG: amidase [Comamonadaceae bacterium]|nr:MAG: amidase [Comamonadaceae bacterium]
MEETARSITANIVAGDTTAVAITEATLQRIHDDDRDLHSFLTVCTDQAIASAARIDRETPSGATPGALSGVPVSIKDTYDTAGIRTTYGSRIFQDNIPAASAPLVERIVAAGGIIIGKTNTSEFAIYPRTVNDLQPETVNPFDHTRTCGGSSGGAAASVAAGLTTVAVGSDGGGSIRIPAALCGVVGLKPSRGAIPRGGGLVSTRRFSCAGPIARSADDARALWRAMAGPSPSDRLSRNFAADAPEVAPRGTTRLRWIPESGVEGNEQDVIDAVRDAVSALANVGGIDVVDSSMSLHSPQFSAAFYNIMMADRLSTGGAALIAEPTKSALLTHYGRHQFERASQVTGEQYSQAVELELAAADHLDDLFGPADLIVTPTVGFVASVIPSDEHIPLPENARRGLVAYTFLANYTGYPAITVPCGMVRGLPVGLQVIGRPHSEEQLLDIAVAVQESVFSPPRLPTRSPACAAERR